MLPLQNEIFDLILVEKYVYELFRLDSICQIFFSQRSLLMIDYDATDDFKNFLKELNEAQQRLIRTNEQAKNEYYSLFKQLISTLSNFEKGKINDFFYVENFLLVKKEQLTYSSKFFGNITYSLSKEVFDSKKYNTTLNDYYDYIYAENSLNNGAAPYSYCYRPDNTRNLYSRSRILVSSPKDSDVLVTVKKQNKVFSHAYIKADSSFTFNVPNGHYQVFFYTGKGWNPHKVMKKVECGFLKGGFISNEVFGKDGLMDLVDEIIAYRLQKTVIGNFNPKLSNAQEAL
jgi:hypothetical protein